jgi:4-hydroxybenzoate polyprenyltransferase
MRINTEEFKNKLSDFKNRRVSQFHRLKKSVFLWIEKNWPIIKDRLKLYTKLTRMDKPIGALLLLWPTFWALWLAFEGFPSLHLFLVFTLGVFLTRSAGCIMNDYADRNFDLHVTRTQDRAITTGKITTREAFLVALVLVLLAFILVLTTNSFTVKLSFFAVLLAVLYPYRKRLTYLPQFFLGLAFSWGILMVFAAQRGSIPSIAWLLFITNLLWVVIFDTIYAMVDREDDLLIGVKSTAILLGDADKVFIAILQAMMLLVLVMIGLQISANLIYYCFMIPATGFMLYHQYLIRDRIPEKCFDAFLNNNWLGMTIFGGFLFNYI